MAHTKSSKKRIQIGERNRLRNQAIKSRTRTYVKKVIKLVEAKDLENATIVLNEAYAQLDKAVSKGVLKKNTAARTKSRLAARVKSISL